MITPKIHVRLHANIMFLVMFIMFISALLGLLVSQYVQYMIKTAGIFHNYYATYYLAYGGLELGLTQAKYHGYGFEATEVTSGASCRSADCQVTTTITSRASVIADTYNQRTDCETLAGSEGSGHTYMELGSGDCFITPLYYDATSGFNFHGEYTPIAETDFLNADAYNPSLYNLYADTGTGETYSIRIIDEGLENLSSVVEPTTESPTPYSIADTMPSYSGSENNYLIVANPTASTKKFCLSLDNSYELPMKYINIVSIGEDGNNTISLNAIKNNELPSFLCYGTINSP